MEVGEAQLSFLHAIVKLYARVVVHRPSEIDTSVGFLELPDFILHTRWGQMGKVKFTRVAGCGRHVCEQSCVVSERFSADV